ncbi:DMT family transporter [Methylorubrum thiocyanatum]|uniref:Drug/metabolite transporter (DMT)-like permease n=1 Tax=Methylorubrum thiocyanatum TaxID=47958 RepID=A0AA40S6B3_9HYPH|nr:DMT family transporter [Methylorubrum thiocyanatum]MBA8915283.1 drug/metabolite transporter (DMT)-like permease [Methylorubrum thiocyanatum]GJE81873.1 putative amino-acid metabolite efflux pump [Methylorubrum thiocyanatum]
MSSAVNRPMSVVEWAMLLSLSVLWGGSFFFTGVALSALPPLTLVVLRVGIAALILNLILPFAGVRRPRGRAVWLAFLGMGLLNNVVPFCLIVWGQTHIASGLAAILNSTTPLFTVVAAHWLTSDERMTGNRLVGALIGLGGVAVMIGAGAMAEAGGDLLAQLAVLGAALSYALAGIFGRRFGRMGVAPLATATGQVTASTLLLLPAALVIDQPWTLAWPSRPVWGAVFGIATLSTALAYFLYFRLLASAGATNLLLVTFLIPVSAILLGALVLDEHLEPRHYLGMTLIGCGLVAIDGRLLDSVRARRRESPEIYRGRDI